MMMTAETVVKPWLTNPMYQEVVSWRQRRWRRRAE